MIKLLHSNSSEMHTFHILTSLKSECIFQPAVSYNHFQPDGGHDTVLKSCHRWELGPAVFHSKTTWRTLRKKYQFWLLSENLSGTYSGEIKKRKLAGCVTRAGKTITEATVKPFLKRFCTLTTFSVTEDGCAWKTKMLMTEHQKWIVRETVEKFWEYFTNLWNLYFHF